MLSSIHPLGERARSSRFWVTATAYVLGSVAGGIFTGTVFGGLGGVVLPDLSPATLAWMAAAVAVVALAFDLNFLALPSIHRQVNEDWLTTYRGWVYGAGFGFQLGAGLTTIVPTAAIYAIVLLAFLSGSLVTGAVIGATFGLVRSLAIFTVARVHTLEALRSVHRSMHAKAGLAHRGAIAAHVLVLVVGLVTWR